MHFLWHLHCFWPSCNPDHAIFLVLILEMAEIILHHLKSFCPVLYVLLSWTVPKVEDVNVLKLGGENLILLYMSCRMAMFKWIFKASWIQMKQKAWISWSICLNLLNKQVQVSHFWCCSLAHFLSVCIIQFLNSVQHHLPQETVCSFPLWVGVIINDNYSTTKTTWKLLLKRTGDTEPIRIRKA